MEREICAIVLHDRPTSESRAEIHKMNRGQNLEIRLSKGVKIDKRPRGLDVLLGHLLYRNKLRKFLISKRHVATT